MREIVMAHPAETRPGDCIHMVGAPAPKPKAGAPAAAKQDRKSGLSQGFTKGQADAEGNVVD